MDSHSVRIRTATTDDLIVLDDFIRRLAEEEGLPSPTATARDLSSALFGADAMAHALVAAVDAQPAGFALFYPKYATVTGRRGVHLEDLYLLPQYRGRALGRQIMNALLESAGQHGMVDWWVMRSNDPAIRFYRRLGAYELDGIAVYRLDHPDGDPAKRFSGLSSAQDG